MNYLRSLFGLSFCVGTTLALNASPEAWAQSFNTAEPFPEDLPATGNIDDLNGLQERQVDDWFPPENVSTDSQTLLEINSDNSGLDITNDRTTQIREQGNWQRNNSGDPKQTGGGIPLGTF